MDSIFDSVTPTAHQLTELAALRESFKEIYHVVQAYAPVGRYRALALTAIEEAAMWANKAVTHG